MPTSVHIGIEKAATSQRKIDLCVNKEASRAAKGSKARTVPQMIRNDPKSGLFHRPSDPAFD
jgi:hypothetical protein